MFRQDNSKAFMKDPHTANCRIYIGNINEHVNSQEIETHFAKYGKILGVLLHKGFGFIQFEKEQSVNEAIKMEHQNMFHGRNMIVRRAQSNVGGAGGNSAGPANAGSLTNRDSGPFPSHSAHESARPGPGPGPGRLVDTPQFAGGGGFGDSRGRGRRGGDARPLANRGMMPNPQGSMLGRGNPVRDRSPMEPRNVYASMNSTNTPIKHPEHREDGDRNDCEIIVLSKALTKYAEFIEDKLLAIGLTVDLLYPNEDVPIRRVLANICSRGCMYAILVLPQNQENHSLTLNILHGSQQEHRNILLSDAVTLLKNDFESMRRGAPRIQNLCNVPFAKDRHPDSIHTLISILNNNRMLTVLQYDKLIRYLQDRREEQVKIELGDCNDMPLETTQTKTQQELQQRILSILNKPDTISKPNIPDVSGTPQWSSPQAPHSKPPNTPLLYDPTVQKALDSLMQGNLLQNIGVNRFC